MGSSTVWEVRKLRENIEFAERVNYIFNKYNAIKKRHHKEKGGRFCSLTKKKKRIYRIVLLVIEDGPD